MEALLWVTAGGALGSAARYLLSGWVLQWLGPSFAWGTLAVNLLGCFLIGVLMHVGLTTEAFSPAVRLGLTTGVLGGFTTFSTFSFETLRYWQEGALWLAGWNVAVSVCGCLVACFLGLVAGRALAGG